MKSCEKCGADDCEILLDDSGEFLCQMCAEGCNESAIYDKFMDATLLSEQNARKRNVELEESPMRKRIARHQERPLNRTRFR